MEIEELIEPDRVLCNVEARSKKHALEILSELLASSEPELAPGEIFDSLVARERLGSTAIGGGVALPHGRAPGIHGNIGALLKLSEPVDFDARDGAPVQIIFGLLVPADCEDEHLETLTRVSMMLADADVHAQLARVGSSVDLYALIAGATYPAVPLAPESKESTGEASGERADTDEST